MGHIKNILIECEGDADLVEKRIKEIAQAKRREHEDYTNQVSRAMKDPRKRKQIAEHLGYLINLIIEE